MPLAAPERPRAVVDWDGRPIGWLRDAVVHPRTRTPRSLLVDLRPEARASLGLEHPTLSIPASRVASVRRDEVALAVRLGDLQAPPAEP